MKVQIAATVGRVVGEIAKEREAARIEVCQPDVEALWGGERGPPTPGFTQPLKLWHDSGSLVVTIWDLNEVDNLIDQLQVARAEGEKRLLDFAAKVKAHQDAA